MIYMQKSPEKRGFFCCFLFLEGVADLGEELHFL